MIIDINNKFDEKTTKELLSSLNALVCDIKNAFYKYALKEQQDVSYQIVFDNGNKFQIIVNARLKQIFISYIDLYNNKSNVLTLQDSLNINKYVRDIEVLLKNPQKMENGVFHAYYTEQPLNKLLPLFKEHAKERVFTDNESFFSAIHVNQKQQEALSKSLELEIEEIER